MQDRVPTPGQEGRVLITPESGDPFYAKIEMADNPTQDGTPLNMTTLLKNATAALYGMTDAAVPDDIFTILAPLSQYWWRKTVAEGYEEQLTAWSGQMYFMVCDMSQNSPEIQYASSVTINQETGEVSLASPKSVSITVSNRNEVANTILGKYILGGYSAPTSVIKIDDAAIIDTDYSGSSVYIRVHAAGAYVVKGIASSNIVSLVTSPNRNAYPDNGEQNGAHYQYFGNFLKTGPGIQSETGSYVGTGKAGENNKCTVTASFPINMLVVFHKTSPGFLIALSTSEYALSLTLPYSDAAGGTITVSMADGGKRMEWYGQRDYQQLNVSGAEYVYIAFSKQ